MSLDTVYQWQRQIREMLPQLGQWQSLTLALYSLGMLMVRHSSASRVSEGLGWLGRPETVRRRFERFLANPRLKGSDLCQAWSRWVLSRSAHPHPVLLVDETKLGNHLRIMVVGLAYRSCCIPLAFWAYVKPPCPQVELILTLLCWVDAGRPDLCQPLLQADRGLGTSPDLIRAVEALGWLYLFRVQNDCHCCTRAGMDRPVKQLVKVGETWRGTGLVFKAAGWLSTTVLVVWQTGYKEPWCLVTNAAWVSDASYGLRYWQEASFRDLKSDGWQWQTSQVWNAQHAQRLLLVMTLAYLYTLTLGDLVLEDAQIFAEVARPGKRQHFSTFRLGLRLFVMWIARQQPPVFPPLMAQHRLLAEPLRLCVGV